jgi:hypothetical protein
MTAKKPWTWDAAREKDVAFIDKLPALKGYLDRVNAEVRNFRRAIVREKAESGYWYDSAIIKWSEGGTIECDAEEFAPSADERAAIEAELTNGKLKWPQSVGAGNNDVKALRAKLHLADNDPSLFEFRDPANLKGGGIVFVQQRIDNPDADNIHDRKHYRPWSFWSDDHWRAMEPDGKLPLFGLEQLVHPKDLHTVFLHEGAKPARHCQQLSKDRSPEGRATRIAHPWGAELFAYEVKGAPVPGVVVHIGWIGGATNPHRADLSPLRALSPKVRVVVVCDNDQLGIKVIRELSRTLKRELTMLKFDGRFRQSFDLADPFFSPDDPVDAPYFEQRYQRRLTGDGWDYIGPSFAECSFPATWATKVVPTGKAGRPAYTVRDEFLREWFYVIEADVFIRRSNPHRHLTPKQFNADNAPFSDIADLAAKVVNDASVHVDTICYRPGMAADVINTAEGRKVNSWTPTPLGRLQKSLAETARLVRPFMDFCEHLFPDESDRNGVLRFIATLATRPEIRIRYALLLISRSQGTGKGTLAHIVSRLVGEHNASVPSESAILNSPFNSWIVNKRLVTVAEIHGAKPKEMYQRLMEMITDDTIDVNIKYLASYKAENWAHFIACSNYPNALNMPEVDRRWFVPTVTEKVWPEEKWREFYAWLEGGGYEIVFEWAHHYTTDEANIVRTHHRPPMSAAKAEMIANSRSDGVQLAYELAQRVTTLTEAKIKDGKLADADRIVFALDDIREWVRLSRGIKDPASPILEKVRTLRAALVDGGMLEPERKPGQKEQRRFEIPVKETEPERGRATPRSATKRTRSQYVVANFLIPSGTAWPDMNLEPKEPGDYIAIPDRAM